MKRQGFQSLCDILDEFEKQPSISWKLNQMSAIDKWYSVTGESVKRQTRDIYFIGKKLYVFLNSSVVRSELFMQREQIRVEINSSVGSEVIESIVIK